MMEIENEGVSVNKFFVFVWGLLTFAVSAEESDALTVDRSVSNSINLSFPNDENIRPKESDFEVSNYVLMSNDSGERWAMLTLTNLSSGSRTFEHRHVLALFADGSRKSPLDFKLNFEGNETQSITVSFGDHKFPILSIYSSNNS